MTSEGRRSWRVAAAEGGWPAVRAPGGRRQPGPRCWGWVECEGPGPQPSPAQWGPGGGSEGPVTATAQGRGFASGLGHVVDTQGPRPLQRPPLCGVPSSLCVGWMAPHCGCGWGSHSSPRETALGPRRSLADSLLPRRVTARKTARPVLWAAPPRTAEVGASDAAGSQRA